MNNAQIIIGSLVLIGAGLSAMVIRDYRYMKRAVREHKSAKVEQFIQDLDNHPPTCYDQIIVINNEGDK